MSTHPNNPKKPFTHWTIKKKFKLAQPKTKEEPFVPPPVYGQEMKNGRNSFKKKPERVMDSIYTPKWANVNNCTECGTEIDKEKNNDSHKHICLEKDCPKPVLCPLCWQTHFVKNGNKYSECKYKNGTRS